MIDPRAFADRCAANRVDLATGVPDSLLKSLIAYFARLPRERHVIAANEGNAVGLALGHYLGTGDPALVYLQNSGLGNAMNPLLSLADPEVYGTPMIVLLGWRGRPGTTDEPQHRKQGRVTTALIDAMELPWAVLPVDEAEALSALDEAVAVARGKQCPYILLVRSGSFGEAETAAPAPRPTLPSREEALAELLAAVGPEAIVVATTGMLSRELFELRARTSGGELDLLTVGGMGHASSIALGLARTVSGREVWCLDGDGALLMHLGALAVIADHAPPTLYHAVFNNGVHDSVGGQPTSIGVVDVPAAARALGYRSALIGEPGRLDRNVAGLRAGGGPALLELRVRPGSRADLGRPTRSARQGALDLMSKLER